MKTGHNKINMVLVYVQLHAASASLAGEIKKGKMEPKKKRERDRVRERYFKFEVKFMIFKVSHDSLPRERNGFKDFLNKE